MENFFGAELGGHLPSGDALCVLCGYPEVMTGMIYHRGHIDHIEEQKSEFPFVLFVFFVANLDQGRLV